MQERRGYQRLILDGKIILKTESGNQRIAGAYLENISFGGFAIYAQEKIETDKIVVFELMTPSLEQPLVGKGRIKYVNPLKKHKTDFFTMGIEFTDINKDMVVHLIKRIQLKTANEMKDKKRADPLDFMPY